MSTAMTTLKNLLAIALMCSVRTKNSKTDPQKAEENEV